MVSGDNHTSGRFHNYSRAPVPANRSYASHGTYNSRDYKSVPGLVTDPNDGLTTIDRAIRRGQQETLLRTQQHYPTPRPRSNEMLHSTYRPSTMTRPYIRTSLSETYFGIDTGKPPINPLLLAFLPGLTGCGLLVTAILLIDWMATTTMNSPNLMVAYQGLFAVCTTQIFDGSQNFSQSCVTIPNLLSNVSEIALLYQSTRGLVIIAAVISFIAAIVCLFLGFRRWERKKGAVVTCLLFTLAGFCSAAGMGCYSVILLDAINLARGTTIVHAGSSFYFGWGGTGCILIASVISVMAHCTRRK